MLRYGQKTVPQSLDGILDCILSSISYPTCNLLQCDSVIYRLRGMMQWYPIGLQKIDSDWRPYLSHKAISLPASDKVIVGLETTGKKGQEEKKPSNIDKCYCINESKDLISNSFRP